MQIEPALLARLSRLLGVEAADLRVRRLPGGISNRSFLLTGPREHWVVRLPLAAGGRQTLDHAAEERLLAVAAEAGLAPGVLACDPGTGAVITEYLERAAPWTPEQAGENGNIDRIAATLRRLHGLPVDTRLRAFRPTAVARVYVDAVRAAPSPGRAPGALTGEIRRWSLEFRRLAQAYEAGFAPTALCHNDLVAANILDDGRLWLVDFEYAVRADPILDLAGLAGMNGYGAAQRRCLLDAYYQPESAPFTGAQLDEVVRLVRLMGYFWALSHGNDGGDTQDRRRFAETMAAVLR